MRPFLALLDLLLAFLLLLPTGLPNVVAALYANLGWVSLEKALDHQPLPVCSAEVLPVSPGLAQLDTAHKWMVASLKLNPSNHAALRALAMSSFVQADNQMFSHLLAELPEALISVPMVSLWICMGCGRTSTECRHVKSLRGCEEASKYLTRRAQDCQRMGRFQESLSLYQQAVTLDPQG